MIVHQSWQNIIDESLHSLEKEYLKLLQTNQEYFPDINNFLNAFKTLPKTKTKAILFGQDPYPRRQSALGYAFIDGRVKEIFSQKGLSKEVNKATSLRNFFKMQLCAEGYLKEDTSQNAIIKIDKSELIDSITQLKNNFEKNGILLLNRALIFTTKEESKKHVNSFTPFMKRFLELQKKDKLLLILFGNEAKAIEKLLPKEHNFTLLKTPHPYNISFIQNTKALEYFSTLKLLQK